jgi:Tn7-like transposition protein D/TniQ
MPVNSVYLPRPYEDELLYSIFARYAAYLQPSATRRFFEAVIGSSYASIMYGSDLDGLAQRTALTWGTSARDLLERHTVLPFYGHYLPPELHENVQRAFLKPRSVKAVSLLGLSNSGVLGPKTLRYCKSCVRRDLVELGETFWRRSHQLSGVFLCPEHGELLINSAASISSRVRGKLHDARNVSDLRISERVDLNPAERQKALEVARRCKGLLIGAPSRWLRFSPNEAYQEAARELGYYFGTEKLDTRRLAKDFFQFYGSELLGKLGAKFSAANGHTRLSKVIGGRVYHPTLHVLVQLFFERQFESEAGLDLKFTRKMVIGQIRCPNPYVRHHDDFRIPHISCRTSPGSGEYFHARCSCGYAFTFQKMDDRDPRMPVVSRSIAYGKAFEGRARHLFEQKRSVKSVAEAMGLSHKVADRLVRCKKSKNDLDETKVTRLRADWKATRSRAAYQALLQWDRDWIKQQKHKASHINHQRRSSCSIDPY